MTGTAMIVDGICQIGRVNEDLLVCPAQEGGGFRCERTDEHGDHEHSVGEHTIAHYWVGDGYVCDGERFVGFMTFGGAWPE